MRKKGNRPVCSFVTILVQAAVIWRNSYHSYHHSCPNYSARAWRPNVGVSEFPLHGSKPKKQTKGLKGSGLQYALAADGDLSTDPRQHRIPERNRMCGAAIEAFRRRAVITIHRIEGMEW